jgi:hypothetical protein
MASFGFILMGSAKLSLTYQIEGEHCLAKTRSGHTSPVAR